MKKLKSAYPGEVLLKNFLIPSGISVYKLSKDTRFSESMILDIINGKEKVIDDTALRLSKFFDNSAKFWLNTQKIFDIEEEKRI